jgi:signal transduction histidine kinase
VSGTAQDVDPSIGLTAFRVVQEGITNAAKHGGGSRTEIELAWTVENLAIRVSNRLAEGAATSTSGPPGGLGLIGLNERVCLVGGSLSWSTRDDFFDLRAHVPVRGLQQSRISS